MVRYKDEERLLEFIEEISEDLRDSDEYLVEVLEVVSTLVKKNKTITLSLYDTDEVVEFLTEWSNRMEEEDEDLADDLRDVVRVIKSL